MVGVEPFDCLFHPHLHGNRMLRTIEHEMVVYFGALEIHLRTDKDAYLTIVFGCIAGNTWHNVA